MLYQRLVAGQVVASHKGKGFDKFTWSDLTTLVQEQTSALMNNLQRSEEKVRKCLHYCLPIHSNILVLNFLELINDSKNIRFYPLI